jgi:tRNA G18 (ribose-2'-O)-methylase SpoU
MLNNEVVEQLSHPDAGRFVVEGRWCVEALLDSDRFETVAVIRAEGSQEDFDEKYPGLTELYSLPKSELSKIAGFAFHRGILAIAKRPVISPVSVDETGGIWVACPELADESNLGAIVRTAAALGAAGILLSSRKGADVFSRKSIRASSGAVFRLPICECVDLEKKISGLKGDGFFILGTSPGADCISLHEVPQLTKAVVVFGPEKNGLSRDWLDLCDLRIQIPMSSGMDSLNVAASAAIVLYWLLQS